jgi:hypothetical protein
VLWLVAAAILAVVAVGFVVLARWTAKLPAADAPASREPAA